MIRRSRIASAVVTSVVSLLANSTYANITLQFIDNGTPTDGTLTMTGWEGCIIRLVSDSGPITHVNIGSNLSDAGIAGAIVQRWIDTTGQGKFYPPYVQTSPGFGLADNSVPSVDNFDSHLLGDPTHFVVHSLPGEAMVNPRSIYLRTGLPSTNTVGYVASFPAPVNDAFALVDGGRIWGSYDVLPQYQATSIDVAYLVTDSSFVIRSIEASNDSESLGLGGQHSVPEPGSAAVVVAIGALLRRRRRR